MATTLTFDKSSARHTDANGYLHVSETPISKAIINPYRGSEIPNAEQLGLDPNKVYYLLRDPKELKHAAGTFNNLPILDKHIPVSALDLNDPDIKKHVVGSTGTDAEFKDPYLVNSMVLHTASAIKDVEAGSKAELSCAYRYKPVMTPGTYDGKHYDGIMTELEGNHVAIVNEGRAGHDVKVMDAKMAQCSVVKDKLALAFGYDRNEERLRLLKLGADAKDCAVGSITMGGKDSNPEGINQYNAAAGIADKASEKAKATGKRDDHIKAAGEHLNAAKTAPNDLNRARHEAMAKFHMMVLPKAHDASITRRKDVNPKAGKSEYGSVKFADAKNNKYPLDTPEHVRSAASYFGMAKNRSKYSQEEQTIIDKRIGAAKKKFKIGAEGSVTEGK